MEKKTYLKAQDLQDRITDTKRKISALKESQKPNTKVYLVLDNRATTFTADEIADEINSILDREEERLRQLQEEFSQL